MLWFELHKRADTEMEGSVVGELDRNVVPVGFVRHRDLGYGFANCFWVFMNSL
jgi:hypothetical protein